VNRGTAILIPLVAIAVHFIALEATAADPDSQGILIKPIPEKLVVLTFDDGCASSASIVAPMLKRLGFGGTFYISDFDSFATRKDWYLTWRQMKALADDGFEVGNHSRGHGSFKIVSVETCTGYLLGMEAEMVANNVPKPTTFCWPFYDVNPDFFRVLAAHGYSFGRGGHSRAYRPTLDSPFDVPSFSVQDGVRFETFVSHVQRATRGRIAVITFHGVPDMEHPSVGLDPATFRVMMQYLKDNDYKVIAMRDLAEYIDVAKAWKLPPTTDKPDPADKPPGDANAPSGTSAPLADKAGNPYVFKDILAFAFSGLPAVRMPGTHVSVTVPYATDVTALSPSIKVSAGATIAPASGAARDFTRPQTYTVTGQDGSSKAYTVTVNKTAASAAKDMLTFVLPGPISGTISGASVGVYVPPATDVTPLAPTFTLSPFATAVPASGTARDFTTPQTYTVTAQDGSTQRWTVTVIKSSVPNAFTWSTAAAGNWSDGSKWKNNLATGSAPIGAGQPDYVLNFNVSGHYTATNDLNAEFLLNQLNFGGSAVKVDGKGSLAFAANGATAALPRINQNSSSGVTISAPLKLAANLTVGGTGSGEVNLQGLISGAGSLTKDNPGALRITHAANTYSGGTVINSGSLDLILANAGLGTGPIMLNDGAALNLERIDGTNPLILNGGSVHAGNGFGCSWNSAIILNGNTKIRSYANMLLNNKSGNMSGPGGFTQTGGTVTLSGINTYTGSTTVGAGTLRVTRPASLYNGDAASWTPAKITVSTGAMLRISVGGPGEFTGTQADTLLQNLTTAVDHNGLMAGASFGLDTANATDAVTISASIADSKGPGGGAFVLRKCGAGTLRLAGANTYTGQTILEGGTLSVASFNLVSGGKASSSLGAPTTADSGEIVLGSAGSDGSCTLVYTGTGETTDREINLAGKTFTVTFDQSGTGPLKLAGAFVISGYGANKTIALKGSTAGTGEIAASLIDPYGTGTTALTMSGAGTWTLSGANSYTGPTTVARGTLSISSARSLGASADVHIAEGATLDLNFQGHVRIRALTLAGKPQPAGTYSAANAPLFIKGTGILSLEPSPPGQTP